MESNNELDYTKLGSHFSYVRRILRRALCPGGENTISSWCAVFSKRGRNGRVSYPDGGEAREVKQEYSGRRLAERAQEACLMSFYAEIKKVIKREGGYVNDPDDPGGETRYGISKKSYPNVDIKTLSVDDAVEIYKNDYWIPAKVERLPDRLQGQYFDMVVNQGINKSVKILQRACNGKNKKKIEVDGKIGPNTIKASVNLESDRLRAYRIMEYARIAITRPKMEKYYYGWVRRALHA